MYISSESAEQTTARLRRVIAAAQLRWLEGAYAYEEYPLCGFPANRVEHALAFVRDEQVWSVLVPATDAAPEPFAVFSFHFAAFLDNSGFVGWLASEFKARLGTGVFVICGHNVARGGVFDYWGVPMRLRKDAADLVSKLRLDIDHSPRLARTDPLESA